MPKILGQPVVVAVDPQGGGRPMPDDHVGLAAEVVRNDKMRTIVASARELGVPVVFLQEVHKPSLVDIGRELDGAEGPHCIEGAPQTDFIDGLSPLPEEFHIRKRRYSGFFGTELGIVLRAYHAETLILFGGFTDVCVHYTAVDAHQYDYRLRVATDATWGSSVAAHEYALAAIEYLQRDALATTDEILASLREWAGARTATVPT